jgi:hypothetical protein
MRVMDHSGIFLYGHRVSTMAATVNSSQFSKESLAISILRGMAV